MEDFTLHMAPYHIGTYRQHSYIIAREVGLDLLKTLVIIIVLIYFSLFFHQMLLIVRNYDTVLIKKIMT